MSTIHRVARVACAFAPEILFTIGLLLAVQLFAVAHADAQARRATGSGGRRAPRVIQLQEFVIEGRVQKPNAFYILNRSNLGYEVMDLRTSFLRDVIRSVQREPF